MSASAKRRKVPSRDREWSEAVRSAGKCLWPGGCVTGAGLTAHHGVRRDVAEFRHDLRNGLCLCAVHHAEAEADPWEWKITPGLLADGWVAAGGWFQGGVLVTPGDWRRSLGIEPTKVDN